MATQITNDESVDRHWADVVDDLAQQFARFPEEAREEFLVEAAALACRDPKGLQELGSKDLQEIIARSTAEILKRAKVIAAQRA